MSDRRTERHVCTQEAQLKISSYLAPQNKQLLKSDRLIFYAYCFPRIPKGLWKIMWGSQEESQFWLTCFLERPVALHCRSSPSAWSYRKIWVCFRAQYGWSEVQHTLWFCLCPSILSLVIHTFIPSFLQRAQGDMHVPAPLISALHIDLSLKILISHTSKKRQQTIWKNRIPGHRKI